MTKPSCPACGSPDLRHETDDRHQCRRCLWRCRIDANGTTRDWLSIGTAGTRHPTPRLRRFSPAGLT